MTQGQISVYGHKEICIIQKGTEARRKLVWIYADANSFEKPRSFNERKKNRNHLNYCIFNLVISLASKVLLSFFILWPRRMLRHSKCIKTRSHFSKHCYCISSDKIYDAAFAAVRVNFN